MKSSNYYKRALFALLLSLLLVLLLVACDGGEAGGESSETPAGSVGGDPADSTTGDADDDSDPDGSGEADDVTTEKEDVTTGEEVEKITFTVEVADAMGVGIKNVVVKLSDGETQGVTNASGKATLKAPAGSYTFTLEMIGSAAEYSYDTARCKLSTESPTAYVTFTEKVGGGSSGGSDDGDGMMISADPDGDGNHAEYYAAFVKTGSFTVSLNANETTYLLFAPTVSGQYRFSATSSTASVSIGYHGMPHFVQTMNVADVKGDGFFELDIRPSSINTADGTGTMILVIGIKTTNGAAADAIVKIERFADHKPDISDMPYEEIQADPQYLKKTPEYSGELTNVDITQTNITLVKGSDGNYHLGSATGPVVMLRITSASPYIDSLQKISENQSMAQHEYDASGRLTRKARWNAVVNSMIEYVNEDGVVPLNDQLIEMMKKFGDHMGWWKETNPQYIFGSVNEVTENAWLFACCYYA